MNSILFQFAMDTVSEAPVEDVSGTLPTAPISAPTSLGSTTWSVTLTDGKTYLVSTPGEHGRISYANDPRSAAATVRFYRDGTTKTFDAVIPSVVMVSNNNVTITEPEKTEEEKAREEAREKKIEARKETRAKEALVEITEAIVRREYAETEVKAEW